MAKKYYSLKTMTRGLCFFYITGHMQTFDAREHRGYAVTPRPNHCFLYVHCDSVRYTVKNGKTYTFKKGNFLYIPKDMLYTVQFFGTEKDSYTDLQVTFRLQNIQGDEYFLADEPICLLGNTPDKVVACMRTIVDATVNLMYPSFPIMKTFGEMLETVANRLWLPEMTESEHSGVFPAMYYLDKHLADDISVTALAAMCMLNETTFRRAFRAATGMSPVQYKTDLRIRKAKELIRYSPEISTDALVEQLGFHDASYFYKTFTKVAGETVKQYRNRHR